MHKLFLTTRFRTEFIDITAQIQNMVCEFKMQEGIILIHVPHTTAGITINENSDPAVLKDILLKINEVINSDARFQHSEGNSDAHIKSSLFGPNLSLVVSNGKLQLGTWQGVFFCEFDGPRKREIWVQI